MTATGLHRGLCGLFIALSAATYLVASLPSGSRGIAYIGLHLALTSVMLAAWATSVRGGASRWTLAAGFVSRLLLLAIPAFTTHDVTRYLMDGAITLAGMDPYRVSPAMAAVPDWPLPLDHASVVTLYPPAALGSFVISALFGPVGAPWAWKVLNVAASCATLGLMARLLRRRGLQKNLPLVALSPLLLLESGVGAHVDGLAAVAVAGALLLSETGRQAASGLLVGLAALFKPIAAAAVLPMASAMQRSRSLRLCLGATLAVGGAYGIILAVGLQPIGSLFVFFEKWRFGSPLFEGLSVVVGPDAALSWAGVIAVGAYGYLLATARRRRMETAALWGLSIPLLASPVVFPWYLLPLVPLVALRPTAFHLAWLTTLPLTYEVLDVFDAHGQWDPTAWPLWAITISWAAALVIQRLPSARRERP